jgi:signal peptide peptidase SppA
MLADRVLGRPLLIDPGKAEIILAVLEGRILGGMKAEEAEALAPDASQFVGSYARQGRRGSFVRAENGTAIVTIDGSLVNRGAWVGANSGLTSYEGIAAQIDDVANDSEIRTAIIDMNSYGGEATGMASLAGKVRNLAKKKRVIAVVNDVAASAGFGIISGAHEIVVSPTSYVGSIGVVMMHLDRSAEMQMKGVRPTFIHAGAHKVDGNPFGALSDDVRAALQRDVNTFYDGFLETVEAGRGKSRLSAAKARATEARTYIGQQAIDAGLADRMGSFEEVLAELQKPKWSGASPKGKARTEAGSTPTASGIAAGANAVLPDLSGHAREVAIRAIAGPGREATAEALIASTMSLSDVANFLCTAGVGAQPAPEPPSTQVETTKQGWSEAMAKATSGRGPGSVR